MILKLLFNLRFLLFAILAVCLAGCTPKPIGDGTYDSRRVIEAATSGIASLVANNPKIFIARRNMLLSGVSVLYQVKIDGKIVGTLGNGEKASYPISPGVRELVIRNMGVDGTGTEIEGRITIYISNEDKYYLAYSAMGWTRGLLKISEKTQNQWLRL